jgi:selenocysteine-specific elongation factor
VRAGDRLTTGEGLVRVRALQALGRPVDVASGPARVALNIVGDATVERGAVLTTPDAFWFTDVVDVRVRAVLGDGTRPPEHSHLHVGAAAMAVRYRPLAEDLARITLERRLPLRIGDPAILRDPGSRRMWGVTVLDPAPPSLRRRGAGAHRAADLSAADGRADLAAELRRRGWAESAMLRKIGVDAPATSRWLVDDSLAADRRHRLHELVVTAAADPLAPGVALERARAQLGVPDVEMVRSLVAPPLTVVDGTVQLDKDTRLPAYVETALAELRDELAENPFAAPTAGRLQELGLDPRAVGAAARAGRLLHLGDGVVLLPGADDAAVQSLSSLTQPFTTSQARIALDTSRRVVLPLLRRLDQRGLTRRLPDDRRELIRR